MAVLTVSREFGSGGREIGRALADLIGYAYVDKERILADVRAAGTTWEKWGKDLDEHCPTVWEKYDWSFRGFSALVQSSVLDYALKDNAVIMGRGGNFLLAGIAHALRARVIAPREMRAERVMARESVDRETAHWLMEKTDQERACMVQVLYGKRWDDPLGYDIVVDAGGLSVEEAVKVLRDGLMEREKLRTPESVEALKKRAVAARVKAAIFTDPKLFVPTLEVKDDEQGIVLRGVIHSGRELKALEEEARRVAGDVPLKFELHRRG